jgi:hypothetical protein
VVVCCCVDLVKEREGAIFAHEGSEEVSAIGSPDKGLATEEAGQGHGLLRCGTRIYFLRGSASRLSKVNGSARILEAREIESGQEVVEDRGGEDEGLLRRHVRCSSVRRESVARSCVVRESHEETHGDAHFLMIACDKVLSRELVDEDWDWLRRLLLLLLLFPLHNSLRGVGLGLTPTPTAVGLQGGGEQLEGFVAHDEELLGEEVRDLSLELSFELFFRRFKFSLKS